MSQASFSSLGEFVADFGVGLITVEPAEKVRTGPSRSGQPTVERSQPIAEGGRNNALTSIAGRMRRMGATGAELRDSLHEVNEAQVDPPLEDAEVDSIAASVSRYEPSPEGRLLSTLNDVGNAHRFVERFGKALRYVPQRSSWLCWRDGRWRWDETKQVIEAAKCCAHQLQRNAETIADESTRKQIRRFANQSLNLTRLLATVTTASSDHDVVVPLAQLDPDPMLLGVANGYVDLRAGSFHEPDPGVLITHCSPAVYDPNAECPKFLEFLTQVMGGDAEMVAFLQRVAGYALTGRTDEQRMLFFYGGGSNGKSTFVNTLLKLLGEYGAQASQGLLVARRQPRTQTNDLARLYKKRLVVSSEVDEGSFLDEALVKDMTGGEVITARLLYQENFEFRPEFKLIMCGNHRPVIRNHDDGIWRRVVLVPFEIKIASDQRDLELATKLEAELPGILNWAIEGAIAWHESGLKVPEKVARASEAYRGDMDVLADWIAERCDVGEGYVGKASGLWSDYSEWSRSNPVVELKSPSFAAKLAERFKKKRNQDGIVYCGIALKPWPGLDPGIRARVALPAATAAPGVNDKSEKPAGLGGSAASAGGGCVGVQAV